MSSYFARLATRHGADKESTAIPAMAPASFDPALTHGEPMEVETLIETSSAASAPGLPADSARPTGAQPPRAANGAHPAPSPPPARAAAVDAQEPTLVPERAPSQQQPVPRAARHDTPAERITSIEVVESAPAAEAATRALERPIASDVPRATPAAVAARAEPAPSPSVLIRATPSVFEAAPQFPPFAAPAAKADPRELVTREAIRVTARAAATPRSPAVEARPTTSDSSPASTRDVEVHIGRIELAVSTAHAPRAAEPPQSSVASAPRTSPREAFNAHRHYLRVR